MPSSSGVESHRLIETTVFAKLIVHHPDFLGWRSGSGEDGRNGRRSSPRTRRITPKESAPARCRRGPCDARTPGGTAGRGSGPRDGVVLRQHERGVGGGGTEFVTRRPGDDLVEPDVLDEREVLEPEQRGARRHQAAPRLLFVRPFEQGRRRRRSSTSEASCWVRSSAVRMSVIRRRVG